MSDSRFKFSPEDFEIIAKYTWCLHLGYPTTNIKGKTVRMHNLILPKKTEKIIIKVKNS
jgi:hypothetical protein